MDTEQAWVRAYEVRDGVHGGSTWVSACLLDLKEQVALIMQSEARRCDMAEALEKSQHDVIEAVAELRERVAPDGTLLLDRVAKLEDHIRIARKSRTSLAERALRAETRLDAMDKHYGNRVIFEGATDIQAQYGGCDDPRKHLVAGTTYVVKRREVHSWHTKIELVDIPGLLFNSVCFGDGEVPPEHPKEYDHECQYCGRKWESDKYVDVCVCERDRINKTTATPQTCETCEHCSRVTTGGTWCDLLGGWTDRHRMPCKWTPKPDTPKAEQMREVDGPDLSRGLEAIVPPDTPPDRDADKPVIQHRCPVCRLLYTKTGFCPQCNTPAEKTVPIEEALDKMDAAAEARDAVIQALVDEWTAEHFTSLSPGCWTWDKLLGHTQDEIKRDPRFPHTYGEDGTCRGGDVVLINEGNMVTTLKRYCEGDVLVRWLARVKVTP